MFRYIVRRLIGAVFVVFIISLVTFSLQYLAQHVGGGSPAYLFLGKAPSAEQVKAFEKQWGLDQPFTTQYFNYVKGIFTGRTLGDGTAGSDRACPAPCLGYSFQYQEPVTDLIKTAFPVTFSLAIGAAVIWLISGVSIGVLSALKKGTLADRSAMVVALAGVSLPVYFTGLILLYVFVYSLHWLPPPQWVEFTTSPIEWARNLILPWITIAFGTAALYARFTRANMLETMNEDYIRTATAKGLPRRKVIGKHALRSALTPVITIFGLDLGLLLGGAILTEKTFSLPGLGYLTVNAIQRQDLQVVLGITIVAAVFIVIANLVVDVVYGLVDPRVRFS
jgi:peptide/nickel transport system permease protein